MSIEKKTVVITGATSGIGMEAAKALCGEGCFVIATGRNEQRCEAAAEKILSQFPEGDIIYLKADFSELGSITRLAQEIKSTLISRGYDHLDVLINNAGIFTHQRKETIDGLETQFQVNYLAGCLLTKLMLPLLIASTDARVISTSSDSHKKMGIFWRNMQMRGLYVGLLAYKQSKLANVLFTRAFNERYTKIGLRAYAVDPGLVSTEIGVKQGGGLSGMVWRMRANAGIPAEKGAETIVYLALQKDISSDSEYWKECKPWKRSKYTSKANNVTRLWNVTESLLQKV